MRQIALPDFNELKDAAKYERFVKFNERMLTVILMLPTEHIKDRRDRLISGLNEHRDRIDISDRVNSLLEAYRSTISARRAARNADRNVSADVVRSHGHLETYSARWK